MKDTGHRPASELQDVYFGQPLDTGRPTRKLYPLIEAQPLPSEELLSSSLSRPTVDRFLRSHHTRLDKWDMMSYVDLDANAIDVDLLSDVDIDILESALKVEANNPVYVRKILDHLKKDVHASNFVVLWGYEEFKHYYALQAYLVKVWAIRFLRETTGTKGPFAPDVIQPVVERAYAVSDEKTEQVRRNGEEVWEIPATMTGLQVMGYTAYQELITHLFYKLAAKRVREPILRGLLVKLAGDEQVHHVVYSHTVDTTLAREPERADELLRVYRDFAMPNTSLVQNGVQQASDMAGYMAGVSPADTQKMMLRIAKFLVGKVGEEGAMTIFTRARPGLLSKSGATDESAPGATADAAGRSTEGFLRSSRGQALAARWMERILRGARGTNNSPAFS